MILDRGELEMSICWVLCVGRPIGGDEAIGSEYARLLVRVGVAGNRRRAKGSSDIISVGVEDID